MFLVDWLLKFFKSFFDKKAPAYTELVEFASSSAGGSVGFATDDFFAPCEQMILSHDPVWINDKYTEFGKWMDGWETRRKRIVGHDWCILKLATKCVIRGLIVNTAFFTGNFTPRYSLQAASLTADEEALIPPRPANKMGTACTQAELDQVERLNSHKWAKIVPTTKLRPGYEETRVNYMEVQSNDAYTHVRVNMYPDGGIARLRVFGEANPEPPPSNQVIDLMSLLNGAVCQGYSNAHFGHPRNMMKPSKSQTMADGWETARRLDRPEILEANPDGTLKVPGSEWAIFKLGFPGVIEKICVDTAHFKGNFPDSVKIEGALLQQKKWTPGSRPRWRDILKPTKLGPHREQWFNVSTDVVSHLRITMAPDGGISRVRTFGYVHVDAMK